MKWVPGGLWLLLGLLLLGTWQLDALSVERRGWASVALVAYALVLARSLRRQRASAPPVSDRVDYCLAYATETGTARQLAQATCKRLRKAGFSAESIALNQLGRVKPPDRALLLVISTTGNGDPPKTAVGWEASVQLDRFAGRPFAVLALGDRSYPRFCAFGLEVAQRFQAAGGKPLFAPVQVSQADPRMIDLWFRQLQQEPT